MYSQLKVLNNNKSNNKTNLNNIQPERNICACRGALLSVVSGGLGERTSAGTEPLLVDRQLPFIGARRAQRLLFKLLGLKIGFIFTRFSTCLQQQTTVGDIM